MQVKVVKQHTFYTGTLKQAWKQLRREFPQYAKFRGEIYRTEREVA